MSNQSRTLYAVVDSVLGETLFICVCTFPLVLKSPSIRASFLHGTWVKWCLIHGGPKMTPGDLGSCTRHKTPTCPHSGDYLLLQNFMPCTFITLL